MNGSELRADENPSVTIGSANEQQWTWTAVKSFVDAKQPVWPFQMRKRRHNLDRQRPLIDSREVPDGNRNRQNRAKNENAGLHRCTLRGYIQFNPACGQVARLTRDGQQNGQVDQSALEANS